MSQPLCTAQHVPSKETGSERGRLALRVCSRPPACPSSGNIPGFPRPVRLCGDNNFHRICALFSIPYRPICPAAPSPPVTLVVGRFMPSPRSSRLASFRIRVRSQARVHPPARIGFVPLLWRISIGSGTPAFRLLSSWVRFANRVASRSDRRPASAGHGTHAPYT